MDRGYACRGKVGAGRDCDEVGSGTAGVVVFKRRLELVKTVCDTKGRMGGSVRDKWGSVPDQVGVCVEGCLWAARWPLACAWWWQQVGEEDRFSASRGWGWDEKLGEKS